ncbi:uncharacterized protein LOC119678398 [Teleopsis dalmanni]|uniref:uncharacterized protein LOC119678398 n=1 Tax=Teleopsis dalmanni TaxID=139649 RepID=UPI0018CFCA39|nr:uncharacterized protein LOC119678398 [Teleopsis dalmanni]
MTKRIQMDRRNMSQVGQCCPACSKNGKSHFLIPKNILRCENNECFYVTEANVHVSNTVNLPGAVASRDDQSINNHTKYVLLNSNHKLNPNNLLTPLKEIQDDFKPNMDIKLIPNNYFNEQYFNFKDQYDSEINIAAHALKNEIFFVNACISQAGDICPKCYREGRTNKLCIFYIETNFAILRCEDINCLYPLFAEAAIKNQNDKSLNAMNSNNNAEYPKIKKFQLKTCSEVSLVSKIMKSKRNFIFPANNNFSSALPLDKEGKRVVKFSITVRASVSGIFSNGKTNINMETEDLKTNDAHAKYLNNLRMSVIGDKLEITQKNLNEDSRVFPTSNHENNVNFMESNLVPNSLKLTRTAKSSLLSPKSCSVYTNTSSENQVVDSRQISKTNNIKSFNSNSSSVISGINHNCNKNKEIKANLNISNERPVFSISNINSNYDTVTRTANDFSKLTNQSTHKAKHLKRSREESESEISNKKYKKDVRHNFHGSNAIKANPNIHEPSVFSVSNINPNYESVSRTVNEFTELICQWIKTANHLKGSPTKSEGDISGGENEIRMMESLSLPVISDKSHDFNGIYETRFSVSNENTDDPVVVKASSYSESIDQRRKPVAHSKRPFKKRRSQSVCGENEIRKIKSSNLPDLFDNNYGFKGRDEIAVQLKTCDAQQRVSVSSKKTDPMATKPNGYSESIDQQMKPSTHSKWSRTKSKSDTSGEENGIRMTESLSLPIISDESHDFNEIYETRLQSKIRDNHPGFSTSNENSDDPVVRKATTYSKSIDQRRNPVAHSKRPIKKPRSQSLCGEYEIRKMKSPSRGLPDLSDNNYEFNGINETAVQLKTCDEQQRFSVSNKNTDDLVAIKASGYTESIDQQMKPSTHSKWSHTKSKSDTSGEENGIRMVESLSLPIISDESHDFNEIYEPRLQSKIRDEHPGFSTSNENTDDPVARKATTYSKSIDKRRKPVAHSKRPIKKPRSQSLCGEYEIRKMKSPLPGLPDLFDNNYGFNGIDKTAVQLKTCDGQQRFSVSNKNTDDPVVIKASRYSELIDKRMKSPTPSKWSHTNSKSPSVCGEKEIRKMKSPSPGLPDLSHNNYGLNEIYKTAAELKTSLSNKNTDDPVARKASGYFKSIDQQMKPSTHSKWAHTKSKSDTSGEENGIRMMESLSLPVISDESHDFNEIYETRFSVSNENTDDPVAIKASGYSESIEQQMKPSTHSKWSHTNSKSPSVCGENEIRKMKSPSRGLPDLSDNNYEFNGINETSVQLKTCDEQQRFSVSNKNTDDLVAIKATAYSESIDQRMIPGAPSKRSVKKRRSLSVCGENEIRKMKSPSRGLPDLFDNNYGFNGRDETAVQLKTCDGQQRFSVSNKNTDDLVAIKASGYTESIDQQMKPSTHSKWSHTKSKSDTSGEENRIQMMESLSLPVISDESHDFKKIYETRFSVSSENPDDPVAINASGYSESIDQRKKPSTHSKWSHTKSKSDTSGEENGIRMVESLSLPVISDESHDFKEMYETRFSVSSKNPDDPAAINASGYSESIDQQMKPSTHSKWPHTNSKSQPFCGEEEIRNMKSPRLPDLFDVSYDFNGIYEATVQPEICNKHPEFSVSNKNTDYKSVTRNVNGFSESINQCTKTATYTKSFRRESEDHASGRENEICKMKPRNLSVDSHRKKEIGVQLQVCDEHLAFPISNINFNYESVKKNANAISIFDPIEEQTQTTEHIESFSDISSMLSDASQVITIKENIVNRTEIFDTHPHSFSFNKSYQSANQTIPDLGETFSVSVNKNLNIQSTNTGMSGSSDHTYFKDCNKIKRVRETKIVQSKACGELQGFTISTIKKPNAESLTTKDISANDNHFGHHSSYGNIKIDMPSFGPQISDGTLANNISGTNNISVTSNISGTNNISRTNNISGTNNIITDTKPVAKTQQRKKRKRKIKLSKDPVEVIPLVYNKKIQSATNKLVESPMSDSKKLSNLTAGKSETFSNKAYAAKCDMSYKCPMLNEPITNSLNNNRKTRTNTETEEGSTFKIPNVFGPLKIRAIKNEEISKQSNNIENIKNTKKGSNESLTNSTSEDSKTDFEQIIDISDDFDIMKIINEQSTDKMSDSMYDDFLNVLSTEFYTSDETIKNDQSKSADIQTADSNEVQIMEKTFDTISFENMDNIMKHNENNNITVIVPQDQIVKSDQVANEDIKISVSYDINEHMSYSINFADLNNTISTNAENCNSKNDTLNEQFDINKLDIISNIQLIEPTTEQSLENTITVLKTETLENNSNKSEGLAIYMSKVVDNETVYSRKGRKRSRLSGSTPSIPQPNDDLKLETLKNIVSTKKKLFKKKL